MRLEHEAVKQLGIGGLLSLPILCVALIFAVPKAKEVFHYGEVYHNLLVMYGDTNRNKKIDEKEEKAFQDRIINNSSRNINFVQIIDIPHTEYPQDAKTHQLIPTEEFSKIAEKAYSL